MSEKLFYVHGYGFALGSKALNLEGDGPLTEDKRKLLELWDDLQARLATAEAALDKRGHGADFEGRCNRCGAKVFP